MTTLSSPRAQIERLRSSDVLVGGFGADLVSGFFMHRGASLIEVRPFGFEGRDDGWTAYYKALPAVQPPCNRRVNAT